jgi:hypothetical protein
LIDCQVARGNLSASISHLVGVMNAEIYQLAQNISIADFLALIAQIFREVF